MLSNVSIAIQPRQKYYKLTPFVTVLDREFWITLYCAAGGSVVPSLWTITLSKLYNRSSLVVTSVLLWHRTHSIVPAHNLAMRHMIPRRFIHPSIKTLS